MPVALDETGNRQLPVQVDHLRARPDALPDLRIRPDHVDRVVTNRNRLRFRRRGLHGENRPLMRTSQPQAGVSPSARPVRGGQEP